MQFLQGLVDKFRQANSSTTTSNNPYPEKVAEALGRTIQDKATHIAEECPICLDTPLIEKACITSNCGHFFCKACLLNVLKKTPDCPVCMCKVESKKIIFFSKAKDGSYSSFFQHEKHNPLSPIQTRPLNKSNVARQVLQNAVNGAKSSKLEAVLHEIHQIWDIDPRSKVLVFSQFLGFFDLMENALDTAGISFGRLDGKLSLKQRVKVLDDFKASTNHGHNKNEDDKTGSVLLISMKAGGVGLNLCIASSVLIVDPWWNQSIEDQCISRIYRIGQMASMVRVRKFVVENSVEEQIVQLQDKKKNMAKEIYHNTMEDDRNLEDDTTSMSNSRPTIDDFKMIFGNLL